MTTPLALACICIFSYYLIVTDYYDDGIVGRMALAAMSFAAGLGFCQYLDGNTFDPVSQVIFAATALFQGRHIYRVLRAQIKIRLREQGLV